MANTYTQMYVQLVFAVKFRAALVDKSWKDDLYKYITGIVQKNGHKMLQINGMPDHIHIFIGYNPNQKIPDLVENIKTDSSHYIKHQGFCDRKFNWQGGYGAFSYARSQVDAVEKYIINQEKIHQKRTFEQEYLQMLEKFGIEHNPKYLFDFSPIHSWQTSNSNIAPAGRQHL
jgi:REP element-mobilizing transposase RayT